MVAEEDEMAEEIDNSVANGKLLDSTVEGKQGAALSSNISKDANINARSLLSAVFVAAVSKMSIDDVAAGDVAADGSGAEQPVAEAEWIKGVPNKYVMIGGAVAVVLLLIILLK